MRTTNEEWCVSLDTDGVTDLPSCAQSRSYRWIGRFRFPFPFPITQLLALLLLAFQILVPMCVAAFVDELLQVGGLAANDAVAKRCGRGLGLADGGRRGGGRRGRRRVARRGRERGVRRRGLMQLGGGAAEALTW